MATEKKYKGMTAYEVGKTQGHSKRKVDSMIASAKAFGAKHKALKAKTEKTTGTPIVRHYGRNAVSFNRRTSDYEAHRDVGTKKEKYMRTMKPDATTKSMRRHVEK